MRLCTVTIPELPGLLYAFPVVRVDFSPEAQVTEHPVEVGAEVADHVQVRPLRFTVETFVTASPAVPLPGNVELALTFLEQAQGKVLVVVIDGEGTFTNYVLEAWPHSVTVLDGRAFSLRFKQIRLASAISVTIPARMPAPVAAVGAPTEAPLGQQAVAPVPPSSTLFEIGSFLGSFLPGGG